MFPFFFCLPDMVFPMNKQTFVLSALSILIFSLAGCSSGSGPKNERPRPVEPPQPAQVSKVVMPPPAPMVEPMVVPPKFVLKDVNFEFDKATLTPAAQSILDDAARFISNHPDLRYQVNGHTDSRGSDAYNQALSERRGHSVLDYMVSRGASRDQVDVNGYGESQPIESNDTDAGRAENRRVEIEPAT